MLLGLDVIPPEIYDQQSAFYAIIQSEYGAALDTRNSWTKVDWELFVAAVSSTETRDAFISTVARWINATSSWRALTDLLDTQTGGYPGGLQFTARPVVGGTFSILALPYKGGLVSYGKDVLADSGVDLGSKEKRAAHLGWHESASTNDSCDEEKALNLQHTQRAFWIICIGIYAFIFILVCTSTN